MVLSRRGRWVRLLIGKASEKKNKFCFLSLGIVECAARLSNIFECFHANLELPHDCRPHQPPQPPHQERVRQDAYYARADDGHEHGRAKKEALFKMCEITIATSHVPGEACDSEQQDCHKRQKHATHARAGPLDAHDARAARYIAVRRKTNRTFGAGLALEHLT